MAHGMALVTEYHGSLGVWVEELYREIRAGKTFNNFRVSQPPCFIRELVHRAFSGVPDFYS